MSRIIQIAAVSRNGFIGKNDTIPWDLPEDLRHFKMTTIGHTVIMGRKTFKSLGFTPLRGRTNVIVSSSMNENTGKIFKNGNTQAIQCVNIDDAISTAVGLTDMERDIFIIGGSSLYSQTLEHSDSIILSRVDMDVDGDCAFPLDALDQFKLISSNCVADSKIPFTIETYERV